MLHCQENQWASAAFWETLDEFVYLAVSECEEEQFGPVAREAILRGWLECAIPAGNA